MYIVIKNICHVNTVLVMLDNSARKFFPYDSLLLMISCPVIIIEWRP